MADADSRFIDILYSCDPDKYWPSKIFRDASQAYMILWHVFLDHQKFPITADNCRNPLLLYVEYANCLTLPEGEQDPVLIKKFNLTKKIAADCIRIDQFATRGLEMLSAIAHGDWPNYCAILQATAVRLIDFEHQEKPKHFVVRSDNEAKNEYLEWLKGLSPSLASFRQNNGRTIPEQLIKQHGRMSIPDLAKACGSYATDDPAKWLENQNTTWASRWQEIGLKVCREDSIAIAVKFVPEKKRRNTSKALANPSNRKIAAKPNEKTGKRKG